MGITTILKMKRIIVPAAACGDIPFYLSVEEWCALYLPAEEYFFAWQVSPSIICGRHQDIETEVNLPQAAKEGIKVWRRKSGGGAVLADMNNVMFSYITPSTAVQTGFDRYTSMVCDMLKSLGIDAQSTGRNDIAVNGQKVAGNAFLKLPGRSIVHGTMLYDSNFQLMARVLTPSRAKRMSKGVVSVPSRVTTLRREGMTLSCPEFIEKAVDFLCPTANGAITLGEDDLAEVMRIRESYLTPEHLRITPGADVATSHRTYIEGVGELIFKYSTDISGNISHAELRGDFFPLQDVDSCITSRFIGCKPDKESLAKSLDNCDIPNIITGLTNDTLLSAICPDN